MKSQIALLLCFLLLCACTVPISPVPSVPEATSVPKKTELKTEADESKPVTEQIPLSEGEIDPLNITSYESYAYCLADAVLDGSANQNLSPYSLYFALVMLAEGAVGQTQEELVSFLGAADMESLRAHAVTLLETVNFEDDSYVLDTNNSLWMEKRHEDAILPSYLDALSAYRAECHAADFTTDEAAKRVSDWIAEHTRGTIEPELQFSPATLAVLVNTVYLLANWRTPFDETDTRDATFTDANGAEHTVPFMYQGVSGTVVVQGDGFLRYSSPLSGGLRMTFVLPDADQPLSRLLWRDGVEKLLTTGAEMQCDVRFSLPKFSFDAKYELLPLLESLGLSEPFGTEADYSALSTLAVSVDSILQETHLNVNENGVEAAAYTLISLRGASLPRELPLVELTLDRPFLFAIEAKDGTPLFIGTVTNP